MTHAKLSSWRMRRDRLKWKMQMYSPLLLEGFLFLVLSLLWWWAQVNVDKKCCSNQSMTNLGAFKAAAFPRIHCITGWDTRGHIRGKSKKAAYSVFYGSPAEVKSALAHLGTGNIQSPRVLSGCEEFLWQVFSTKKSVTRTLTLYVSTRMLVNLKNTYPHRIYYEGIDITYI